MERSRREKVGLLFICFQMPYDLLLIILGLKKVESYDVCRVM